MAEGDCGYVCFYRGQRWECYAPTLYSAKQLAIAHFKIKGKNAGLLSVVLAERPDGTTVVQIAD